MSVDAVDQRWDGFLAQIRGRFDAIMQESIAGCMALFEQTGETLTLGNAWTGMRVRAMELGTKVQDTWDEKVSATYEDADASAAQEDAARRRGEELQEAMEIESVRVEMQIYCDIARVMQARALAEQGDVRCTQCGASLAHSFSFRAINLTCGACAAVNTVEPGTSARMVEGHAHHLCMEAAWPAWLAMHAAERVYREARTAKLSQIQAFEAATIDYWTQHLEFGARLLPDRAGALEADLRGKMHPLYVSLRHERAWIDAGRPRKIPPPAGVSV